MNTVLKSTPPAVIVITLISDMPGLVKMGICNESWLDKDKDTGKNESNFTTALELFTLSNLQHGAHLQDWQAEEHVEWQRKGHN